MANTRIKDLQTGSLSSSTYLPIDSSSGGTRKIATTSFIKSADIVDNLTSSDATKPLSAKQGKALQDRKVNTSDIVDNLTTEVATKPLSAKQGKVLEGQVGEIGNSIGTQGWNQICANGNFTSVNGWEAVNSTISASGGIMTITDTNQESAADFATIRKKLLGIYDTHKYYVGCSTKAVSGTVSFGFHFCGINTSSSVLGTDWTRKEFILTPSPGATAWFQIRDTPCALGDVWQVKNVMVVDLTELFGSGNEPATADEFRAMFPADYYPFYPVNGKTTLWANASPSSSFAAQDITFDKTGYNRLQIMWKRSSGVGDYYINEITTSMSSSLYGHISSGKISTRSVDALSTGLIFGTGYVFVSYGDSKTENNDVCIPYRIVGTI